MRKFAFGLGCVAMLGVASSASATIGVIVDEDFESYSSTSAMEAVWAGSGATLVNEIDDDSDGTPEVSGIGNFAFHTGGSVNELILDSTIYATSEEWIRVKVDIYDNDTSLDPFFPLNPSNKRMSLGLRSDAPANIVELGVYNSTGMHLSYRGILFDSINGTANPNWQSWDMGTELVGETELAVNRFRGGAWYTLQATIKAESVLYEVDFDYDGIFDYAVEHIDMPATADGFNAIRFGGPSGISSSGGGITFDNVLLEIIAAETELEGDLNGDGFVGLDDLDIILSNWNQSVTPNDPADPSGDGYVGLEDLDTVLNHWNEGTPPTPASVVPEPATLALIGLGGLAMIRRR